MTAQIPEKIIIDDQSYNMMSLPLIPKDNPKIIFLNKEDINKARQKESDSKIIRKISGLENSKINILITGTVGCGKSSTINALFETERSNTTQENYSEIVNITKHEIDNITLFEYPGLGENKEQDNKIVSSINDKLSEKDHNNEPLIDIILIILDASSRDLGTAFNFIKTVIASNPEENTHRTLVVFNQADMAMKGKGWNHENNEPDTELVNFLNAKMESTSHRIKEATGIDVSPIYYSSGYKDEIEEQKPYNISKLLSLILKHTKKDKIISYAYTTNGNAQQNRELMPYMYEILKHEAFGIFFGSDSYLYSSACWRNYVGVWEIRNNKLYLINVSGLFRKTDDEPIFAEWYSGELNIAQGDMLNYTHNGFDSIYEKTIKIKIKNGIVIEKNIIDNRYKFKLKVFFDKVISFLSSPIRSIF